MDAAGGGERPAITTVGGGPTVVEVHQTDSPGDKSYWSTVGHFNSATNEIEWGEDQKTGDSGDNESIAVTSLSDGTVIQIHEASGGSDEMYYQLGTVQSGNTMDWGSGGQDMGTTGTNIGVTNMDDQQNTIIAIHEATSNHGIWYQIGQVGSDRASVDWGESQDTGTTGSRPAIAAIDQDTVIEVHESSNGTELWYSIGQLSGDAIDWGTSHDMDDSGIQPQLAVLDSGAIVQFHLSQAGPAIQSYYSIGQVQGDTVSWGESQKSPYVDADIQAPSAPQDMSTSMAPLGSDQVLVGMFKSEAAGSDALLYGIGTLDE